MIAFRRFYCATAPILLLAVSPASPARGADLSTDRKRDARPNILFCFADDWGRYASAYRTGATDNTPNAVVRTPNFDRIAKEGVLFNNAFVPAPSCTPCRSSLLSGQYFYRTGRGAILQGAIWDNRIPSYPLILKDRGYIIGHSAKVWSPGRPANAPYGARAFAFNKAGGRFNRFSQFVSAATDKDGAKQTLYDEVRANFEAFLKVHRERSGRKGKPWCYWFGPTNCHRKWVKGSGKALWGLNPDDLKGKLPPFLPDVPVVRQDFCDYLGEVQAFDAAVGVLLKKLEETGQLDNTLIVVSGDHGIPGFPRGKCNLYDFGVAVPLAVRWGKKVPGGRVVDDFTNLMDLAPTFVEAGGGKPPKVMTGRSLLPVLTSKKSGLVDPTRDYVVVGRERHVAAARAGNLPYPHRAIRTKDFLYIRNFKPDRWPMGDPNNLSDSETPSRNALTNNTFVTFADMDASPTKAWVVEHRGEKGMKTFYQYAFGRRPAEELYDLRKDPHQLDNVATDGRYAAARKKLSSRLMSILKTTGDPRVTGDGDTFEKPPFTSPVKRRKKKRRKTRMPGGSGAAGSGSGVSGGVFSRGRPVVSTGGKGLARTALSIR
ncbi:MAG: sulfatase [Planctomycetaceae bacterium]